MSATALAAPKTRILYSEDNPDSRELMCLLLAREGFETVCPDTSDEVLKAAREGAFDAYILDNWTPGISGIELCKKIRQFDPDTPIIFYSAAVFPQDKEEARAAGAQAYIDKPAGIDGVVDTIRSTLSAARQVD
jgi:CheY-like chemotaxis protein